MAIIIPESALGDRAYGVNPGEKYLLGKPASLVFSAFLIILSQMPLFSYGPGSVEEQKNNIISLITKAEKQSSSGGDGANVSIPKAKELLDKMLANADKIGDKKKRADIYSFYLRNSGKLSRFDRWDRAGIVDTIIKWLELVRGSNKNSLSALLAEIGLTNADFSIVEDMDGDGAPEYFLMFKGPWADGDNLALTEKNGIFTYLKFGSSWGTEKVAEYTADNSGKKVILFRSSGGNGAGGSSFFLVGLDGDQLKVLFASPGSSSGGTKLIDIDGDGKKEILCDEQIEYKRLYWPIIYKWDGEKIIDATFSYPEYMKKAYKDITDLGIRRQADQVMLSKGEGYKNFWHKYIEPIKLAEEQGVDRNAGNRPADEILKDIATFIYTDNDGCLDLIESFYKRDGLNRATASAVESIFGASLSFGNAYNYIDNRSKATEIIDMLLSDLANQKDTQGIVYPATIEELYWTKANLYADMRKYDEAMKSLDERSEYFKNNVKNSRAIDEERSDLFRKTLTRMKTEQAQIKTYKLKEVQPVKKAENVIAFHNNITVTEEKGNLIGRNIDTGMEVWRYAKPVEGQKIYLQFGSHLISGDLAHWYPKGGKQGASKNKLEVYCINISDGKRLWKKTFNAHQVEIMRGEDPPDRNASGRIVVRHDVKEILIMDIISGAEVLRVQEQEIKNLAGNYLVYQTKKEYKAFDIQKKKEIFSIPYTDWRPASWSFVIDDELWASTYEGQLGSGDDGVRKISLKDGLLKWAIHLPRNYFVDDVIKINDELVLAKSDYQYIKINSSDGKTDWGIDSEDICKLPNKGFLAFDHTGSSLFEFDPEGNYLYQIYLSPLRHLNKFINIGSGLIGIAASGNKMVIYDLQQPEKSFFIDKISSIKQSSIHDNKLYLFDGSAMNVIDLGREGALAKGIGALVTF